LTGVDALGKERRLIAWLGRAESVLIGYSGGVDSAYLACVAVETLGAERVLAVIGRSASYPDSQWSTALSVADQFGIPILAIDTDEIADPRYAANPTNRCYYCKAELWGKLTPIARQRNAIIVDGTNADDLLQDRPGSIAGKEHDVASPLAHVGLTKAEIRERSRERGIPTWNQPSAPCLASRIPHGTPVTVGRLKSVERAESTLRALGVQGNLRVRHQGEAARVEVDRDQLEYWLTPANRQTLEDAVRQAGYAQVIVDPAGYRTGGADASLPGA
jgi:pyridinium-3,5-biscarboxylic acid mononucleotide sulfurtransferase